MALMPDPPRCNARYGRLQQVPAVLAPLFVKGNFLNGWRREVLAADALAGLVAAFDEARQSMHAAVIRSTVEGGVIDARFACFVLSH
jgi:hypothetical protein